MSITQNPSVVLSGLSFTWPDGTNVLDSITAAFSNGRTGLLGTNGTGKTTLLRLIAGDMMPTTGTITVTGHVGYLPQHLVLQTTSTVADLLGIRGQLDALRAIESGDADPRHFDALGDAWDVDARARASLDGIGLSNLSFDREVGTLSGGETILTALAGLRLSEDEIVLLDEPTNNLDRQARHDLYDAIREWRGALVVVSHDVTLLDLMDNTAELRTGSLTVFGGNYSAFRQYMEQEQAAAEQALRTAEQKVKTEERQRIDAQTKLARRQRYARTDFENKRKPKMIMNQRKTEAQVSAGKLRGELDEKVDAARREAEQHAERVRRDTRIRIDLPDPHVPAGRRLAELRDGRGRPVVVQGPERIALTGRNGVGKTRLLRSLIYPHDAIDDGVQAVQYTDRIGYLPQRLDHLDDERSILDTVRAAAPQTPPGDLRANLARFLFRSDTAHRRVGDLSGGERFRVALATLLLAEPPNQLLVLDEPTNNLDLRSIDELVSALETYRGGLIVVSHDDAFLARLHIDTWISLDENGLTHERAPHNPQEKQ
ncbi:ABC-F family ATP-binding cassette domain-containing protein [Microbacterium sp. J1-1]|uniref:ABC-F family ATP-binding cassette domain-containing protein n=1 Tax=Microbacterium sp. J1-1 TaxID=2992441 RepID=UPI002114207F|nr:ABC-F family ATP-binding cassette domain-containing protein [Microbacterium sp. J1-1]UUE19308.1 ATP-binding cassette domain-containing protein [Microbacterium sp. J1-1]